MARIRIPAAILAFVLVREFDYTLPEELIAQEPLLDRAQSRMLVLHRSELRWEDRSFRDLPQYLQSGDCLILNKSKVLPSRLFGARDRGTARIEVFLIEPVSEDERTWRALVRPGRKVHLGEYVHFGETLHAQITERGEHGERTLRFEGGVDLYEAIEELGHVPLPPYIRRSDRPADRERYNTVFAQDRGSVAAPTAGLHFTSEALEACAAAGAAIATVTLHVGLGTFAPVHVERIDEISLHSERYNVASGELEKMQRAKRRIAVGTTTVRTVETVYSTGRFNGATNLFIHPGYEFKAVEAMLTNFHLPKSSLLMLVSAFAGREFVLAAYDHAVRERYRFFSYGDCMLIL